MGTLILGTFKPDSPEWHAARRWRVGGSEVATVCGWSEWETRADLLARKLGELEQRPKSKAMERGTMLEPAILAWAAHREGLTYDPAASAATYVHDDLDVLLANPDGVTVDGLLVEAKTCADRTTDKGWGRAGTDQVPLGYAAQINHTLGVLGLRSALLACLHGATNGRPDLGLAIYRLTFNEAAFAYTTRKALAFASELTARGTHVTSTA